MTTTYAVMFMEFFCPTDVAWPYSRTDRSCKVSSLLPDHRHSMTTQSPSCPLIYSPRCIVTLIATITGGGFETVFRTSLPFTFRSDRPSLHALFLFYLSTCLPALIALVFSLLQPLQHLEDLIFSVNLSLVFNTHLRIHRRITLSHMSAYFLSSTMSKHRVKS
jgi:hypothetical protein